MQKKTRNVAFFQLPQKIVVIPKSKDPKTLSAGNSAHIYEQLCLGTFCVSAYFGKSTLEDGKLGRYTVLLLIVKKLRF